MRRTLYPLSLLVLLWGCSVFNGAREPRVHELRRSLDYPVHDASFATDGTPFAIAFTDLMVAPEIASGRWIAFSSGSLGNDDYQISARTLVNLNRLRGKLSWLSMTGIEASPSKAWVQLDIGGIEHLDLAATNVDDRNSNFLRSGEDLAFLDLSGTSVGDASLVYLMRHRKLAYLRLNGTKVGDKGLVRLAAIGSLKVIELIDTRATEAGLESYWAAGGDAEVILARDVGGVF